MVTAPAVASPDSHTLPLSSAGAVLNASKSQSSSSFQTVYDSLPSQQDVAQAQSSDPSASKDPRTKKDFERRLDNSFTSNIAQPVIANVTPARQWTPAITTLSDVQPHDAAPTPASLVQTTDISDPRSIEQLIGRSAFNAPRPPDNSSVTESTALMASAATPRPVALQVPATAVPMSQTNAPLPDPTVALPAAGAALRAPAAPLPETVTPLPAAAAAVTPQSAALPDTDAAAPPTLKRSGKSSSASTGTTAPRQPVTSADSAAVPTAATWIAPSREQTAQENADSRQHAGTPLRAVATGSAAQPSTDASVIHKGLADAIVPRSENLAFSLRMHEADSLTRKMPAAPEPVASAPAPRPAPQRNQTASTNKPDDRTPEPEPDSDAIRTQSHTNMAADRSPATANLVWSEAAAAPRQDASVNIQPSEPRESAHTTAVAAMHEAQPVMPEIAKGPTTSEILLQLGGKDQPAAIRITERAGNVNVAVHAADPDLRSSLRSNLGELASQLSHQGWKTDVVKSATAPRPGDSPQDSHQDGQRSGSQQQAFTQGDRQGQRDRRANGGRWLAEFEEQSSGKPGGKN